MAAVTTSVPRWMNPIVRTVVNRGKKVINARDIAIYDVAKRFASDISGLSPQIQAEAIKGLVPEQRAWVIGGMGDAETLNPEVLVSMGPEAFGGALSFLPGRPAESVLDALVKTEQYQFLADSFPFVNLDKHFNGISNARFFGLPYRDDSETRVPVLSGISNDTTLGAMTGKLGLFGYFQFDPLIQRAPAVAEMLALSGGNFSISLNAGLLQMPVKTAASIVKEISLPAQMAIFRNWGEGLRDDHYESAHDKKLNDQGRAILNKVPEIRARERSGEFIPRISMGK
jgi:hypothetical protein